MSTQEIFTERLISLREERGIKRQQLADDLGITRASLEYYEKGKRKPDLEMIVKIAKNLHVSTDYLLGLTQAATVDKDIQAICDYTGLSSTAISVLTDFLSDNEKGIEDYTYNIEHEWYCDSITDQRDILNAFIEKGYLSELITVISDYHHIMESDVERMNELLPDMLKVKQTLQSGIYSDIDPLEYLLLDNNFPLAQLHYYEMGEIITDFVKKEYSSLIEEHHTEKTAYITTKKDIEALKAGESHGKDTTEE